MPLMLLVAAGCGGSLGIGGSNDVLDDELASLDWEVGDLFDGSAELEHPCNESNLIGCPSNPAPKGTVFELSGYELTYEGTNVYRWSETVENPLAGGPTFSSRSTERESTKSYIYVATAFRIRNATAEPVDLAGDEEDGLDIMVQGDEEDGWDLDPCANARVLGADSVLLDPGEEGIVVFCNVSIATPGWHEKTGQMSPGLLKSSVRLPACGWHCGVELETVDQTFDISLLDDWMPPSSDAYWPEQWTEPWNEAVEWLRSPEVTSSLSANG
jgi:hypothetical protein